LTGAIDPSDPDIVITVETATSYSVGHQFEHERYTPLPMSSPASPSQIVMPIVGSLILRDRVAILLKVGTGIRS
jgi:hypothetical protein